MSTDGHVDVRVYAGLNDLVGPEARGTTRRRPFRAHQTVKDVLEAMGVPHTEIDLIVVDGAPVGFDHRPRTGDRIAAYPPVATLEIDSAARLRPAPLDEPRFVVDVNLGRLARLLRVCGLDVWFSGDADDATLAAISAEQQRMLLTRDRGLLKRRVLTHGALVRAEHVEDQAVEVLGRLDLRQRLAPFTRCVRCNGRLAAVSKADVFADLEPLTRRYYDNFSRCCDCGRIFWPGSHHARLTGLVDRLRARLP